LSIDYHLHNIIAIAPLGLLLEYHERGMQAPPFSKIEREQIDTLCRYYLSSTSWFEALEALNSLKTLSAKAKQFLRVWSGPVSSLFSPALSAKGILHPKIEFPQVSNQETFDRPRKAHFELVRDLILSVGFKSLYILIDKVDEPGRRAITPRRRLTWSSHC
jgi:hypothetical protein